MQIEKWTIDGKKGIKSAIRLTNLKIKEEN